MSDFVHPDQEALTCLVDIVFCPDTLRLPPVDDRQSEQGRQKLPVALAIICMVKTHPASFVARQQPERRLV
jgi:hypothetical protein